MKTKMTITVAGHVDRDLHVEAMGGCGNIKVRDGVLFWHGSGGAWCVRLKDLEDIVNMCRKVRKT